MARSVAVKVLFFSVNILFIISGLCLAFGGCWYSLKLKEVTDLRNYEQYQLDDAWHLPQVMPWIFCSIGLFALLVGVGGVCGAAFNSKGLLVLNAIFVCTAVILLIATAVSTMIFVLDENQQFINATIRDVFSEARKRDDVKSRFGQLVEHNLHCCGSKSYQDYVDIHQGSIPMSCCNDNDTICQNQLKNRYNSRRGCQEVATRYTRKWFLYGTGACAATGFFGVLSMLFNVVLTLSLRSRGKEIS